MRFRVFYICVVFLLPCMMTAVPAGSRENVNQEIAHLLHYIEDSRCIFIRNDKESPPADARAHIERKYDYYKERVKTAEDFIKYAATKSTISGRPYKVSCNGRETSTADWLHTELKKLRNR